MSPFNYPWVPVSVLAAHTIRPLKPLISCERFSEGLRPCDPAKGLALWKPDLGCRGQAPAAFNGVEQVIIEGACYHSSSPSSRMIITEVGDFFSTAWEMDPRNMRFSMDFSVAAMTIRE